MNLVLGQQLLVLNLAVSILIDSTILHLIINNPSGRLLYVCIVFSCVEVEQFVVPVMPQSCGCLSFNILG